MAGSFCGGMPATCDLFSNHLAVPCLLITWCGVDGDRLKEFSLRREEEAITRARQSNARSYESARVRLVPHVAFADQHSFFLGLDCVVWPSL
jgi:hypothetical protein